MFVDEDLDPVDFKSSWKKERSVEDGSTQTKDLQVEEKAVQSIKLKSQGVQVDDDDRDAELIEEDTPELAEFLQRWEPHFSKLLRKNNHSQAFDGYSVQWEDDTDTVTSLHTLTHAPLTDQLQITSIAWNATGSVLVASYGRHDHEDWCTHKSALCTWNLDRRKLDADKPDVTVDLASCLMCVACHPVKPAVIAGGTFNGEVLIWDTSREDEMMIASSGMGDDTHREPVTKLHWLLDSDSKGKRYQVVSVSSDGKMLVWKVSSRSNQLQLVDGFVLMTDSLPRTARSKATRGDQEMGVTCISHTLEDSSGFLIGSESGGIFRCSTQASGGAKGKSSTSTIQLRSPVTFAFSTHHGPVYDVDCSPFHRNLFLSCSTDTTARLYSMLQTLPLLTIEPSLGYMYSTKWSPVRPLVFAAVTESGHLLVYDLKQSRTVPYLKLDANAGGPGKGPVFCMQFNQKRKELLATGDSSGRIQVWQLSNEFTNQDVQEEEILDEIANMVQE